MLAEQQYLLCATGICMCCCNIETDQRRMNLRRMDFYQASMEYVFLLQEVQERKKFEFVETLPNFMFDWLTFYHQGHEVAEDYRKYMYDLQFRIQKIRTKVSSYRSYLNRPTRAEELLTDIITP